MNISRNWLSASLASLVAAPWALAMVVPQTLGAAGETPMKAGPSTLGEAQAYLAPTLEASAVAVADQTLEFGNLRLTMEAGKVSRVMVGGQVVGLFFSGKGALTYLSKDPAEAAVIRYNLDRNGGAKPVAAAGGLQIQDGLKEALLFFAGQAPPAVPGSPAKAPLEEFATHLDWFDADSMPFPGHLAVLAANAPGKAAISGFLRGKEGRYVFLRDEASEHKESLALAQWRELPSVPYLKVIPLSTTWLEGSQRRPPAPAFSVTMVDQDIKVTVKTGMELGVVETVVPRRPGVQVLDFQLRSSVISRPNSINFEKVPVKLQTVETEDGRPLAFDHRMGRLLVKFPQPLAADVPVKIRFKLGGDYLKEHMGYQYWDLGKEPWFPMATGGDRAFKAHMRLQVDKPYTGICVGRILHQESTAAHSIVETSVDVPVGDLAFTVGKFHEAVVRDPRTKVTLHLDSYAYEPSAARTERLGRTIQGLIAFYESFLGPFPFEDLHVVIGSPRTVGTAIPGMLPFAMESGSFDVSNFSLAQSVASQYWGIAVRGRGLDEGPMGDIFAAFCGWVAVSGMKEIGTLRADQVFNKWKGALGTINGTSSISHADWLVPAIRDHAREGWFAKGLKEYKGPLMIEQLCREVGAKEFTEFLKAFQKQFAWKLCDAQDLPEVLNRVTGKDWQPFFEKYYWGTALPE